MANAQSLFVKIMKLEGLDAFTNDPVDNGGATKFGVTLKTWLSIGYDKDADGDIDADDIKILSLDDAYMVFVKMFWNRCNGDKIRNQSIADAIVDWTWTSGKWGIINVQRILGLIDDGIVGPQTIKAINATNQVWLHSRIQAERINFINAIVKKTPSQKKYERGWKARVNSFKFSDSKGVTICKLK